MQESSTTTRQTWDDYFATRRPNAIQIDTYEGYSSTKRFNCHGYAWYMSQKGDVLTNPRWIGRDVITDEDVYWEDGSYIEVASATFPGMVHWASGDHSAITTSTPGKWKSKWNEYPLFLHNWDDTEYGTSNLKYYAPFQMEGPTILCASSNVNYSTPAYLNCTYNWTYDTNRFNYVSGQGTNNFQIAPKNPLVSGQAWVSLTLTINFSTPITRVITKNVWVGPYSSINYPISGPSSAPCRQYVYYSIPALEDVISINWVWPSAWTYVSGQGTRYLALQTGTSGSGGIVGAQAINICTNPGSYATMYTAVTGICGYSMLVSPNPASNEVTIELTSTEPELQNKSVEWELVVYDQLQVQKTKTPQIKDTKYKLNIRDWKDGIYIIRAKIGDEFISEKLVVKH